MTSYNITKTKDFIKFLNHNNYVLNRSNGSHKIYVNQKNGNHITVPFKRSGSDLCMPMVKRLIKEVLSTN